MPGAGRDAGDAGGIGPPSGAGHDGGGRLGDGHEHLRSLLGAWALDACPAEEAVAVEAHMTRCARCRGEGVRLRDAAGWLHGDEPLGPAPSLRERVVGHCLARRPARVRVPGWATAYDAEAARLDAMLRDLNETEWLTRVEAPHLGAGDAPDGTGRWTVAGLLCRLAAGDGPPTVALGGADPVPARSAAAGPRDTAAGRTPPAEAAPPADPVLPTEAVPPQGAGRRRGGPGPGRDEACDRALRLLAVWRPQGFERVRQLWREHSRALVQGIALAGADAWDTPVRPPGRRRPVLRDAVIERAFATWVHAEEIAGAVGQVYEPPGAAHLHAMLERAVGILPGAVDTPHDDDGGTRSPAGGRAPGTRAGSRRRVVRLELEGPGGGEWLVPLDEPENQAIPAEQQLGAGGGGEVAHLVTDGRDFCRLAAGRLDLEELARGAVGDTAAVRDLLHAARIAAAL